MSKLVDFARATMYLAGAILCGSLVVFTIHADKLLTVESANVQTVVTKANQDLDDVHRVLLEAGLTAMEARKASAKESKYLDQWNAGITQTLGNANKLIVSATETSDGIRTSQAAIAQQTVATLKSTQDTIAGLIPVEDKLTTTIETVNKTAENVNTLVVPINTLAVNSASAMGHIDKTTGDVQEWVHDALHPSWPKRIWNFVTGVGIDVGRAFY